MLSNHCCPCDANVCLVPSRQVIGVRETWLHPGLPAVLEAAAVASAKQHDETAGTVMEHVTDQDPDLARNGHLEQQMQAVTLVEE